MDNVVKNDLHRGGDILIEKTTDPLPEIAHGAAFCPGRLEQRTAQLLYLIHEESKHHQMDKDCAQVLFSQVIVMFQVVPLVFECIEGLILNASPGTTGTHNRIAVLPGDWNIRHPGKPLFDIACIIRLPVFQEVEPQ
jgi:hypothetical protein